MSTSLVYLHIPKSAGTSHRDYLSKVYGDEAYFWYGLHSEATEFDAEEVGNRPALGGHRPLDFYPADYDALYTSVVREPVERAISFYNYCIAQPPSTSEVWLEKRSEAQQAWLDKGIDPNSMSKSIENCEAFRVEIANMQCAYLSRYGPTFEGVKKSLQETNIVIGLFDQLAQFNEFFREELAFPMDNRSITNAGRAGYSSSILEEPGVIGLLRSINQEDQALYDYVRLVHGGLYVGAGNREKIRARVPTIADRSHIRRGKAFSWGNVNLYTKGLVNVAEGNKSLVPLILKNGTGNHIVFTKGPECPTAIGWRIQTKSGESVDGHQGICRTDQTIPAREAKGIVAVIDTSEFKLAATENCYIEFGIVHEGEWMWDKFPINSAWSMLHV